VQGLGTIARAPRRRLDPGDRRPVVVLPVLDVVTTVRGHVVRGRFTPSTRELRVLTRPWAGRTFRSPAEAAAELARYFATGATPLPGELPTWRLATTGGVLRASASRASTSRARPSHA